MSEGGVEKGRGGRGKKEHVLLAVAEGDGGGELAGGRGAASVDHVEIGAALEKKAAVDRGIWERAAWPGDSSRRSAAR